MTDRERWFNVIKGEKYELALATTDRTAKRIPLPQALAEVLVLNCPVAFNPSAGSVEFESYLVKGQVVVIPPTRAFGNNFGCRHPAAIITVTLPGLSSPPLLSLVELAGGGCAHGQVT